MPQVSVIIPNYNHARYLSKRIESVLNQTYQDFELIILDDCSKDDSLAVIRKYKEHSKIKRVIQNQTNSGSPFKQWSKGISAAVGKFIWIAESDDFAEPQLLGTLVDILEINKNVGLAYSNSRIVDEDNNLLEAWDIWMQDLEPYKWRHAYINDGREEIRNYAIIRNTIPNASGVVFRKSLYLEVGGADENFRYLGDWHLWIRMLERMDVAYVPDCLNYFRRHSGTTRNSYKVPGSGYLTEAYACIAYILKRFNNCSVGLNKTLDELFFLWHQGSIKIFWKNLSWRNIKLATKVDSGFYSKTFKFAGDYLNMKFSGSKFFKG